MKGLAVDEVGMLYAPSAHHFLLLQLAGFVVNMDTRQQVQKLQHEVMQCTHELSSLQDHLRTGFAEVKERIDDGQDRCNPCQNCQGLKAYEGNLFAAGAVCVDTSELASCSQ